MIEECVPFKDLQRQVIGILMMTYKIFQKPTNCHLVFALVWFDHNMSTPNLCTREQ